MDPRPTSLPPDVQYFLDGAAECGEIDACTYHALALYGPHRDVTAIVDSDMRGQNSRRGRALALCELADRVLADLPAEMRGPLVFSGFSGFTRVVIDLAEVLANWAVTDATRGGALQPFRRRPLVGPDNRATKKTARRLRSPKFAKRYVRENQEARHLRAVAARLILRGADVPPALLYDDHERIEHAYRWQAAEHRRRCAAAVAKIAGAKQGKAKRQKTRKSRRTLRRSAILAGAVLGMQTVGAFARGEPVRIPAPGAVFEFTRAAHSSLVGHGGVNVAVLNPSGALLARLCVYLDGVPALDQLTGFALHIASGEERKIIETGNIMHCTPEGIEHPLLAGRAKARLEVPNPFEAERALVDFYWAETKTIWLKALDSFVFPHPFKRFQ